MKKAKRIFFFMLTMLILFCVLTACGETAEEKNRDKGTQSTNAQNPDGTGETNDGAAQPDFADITFDGYEFTFLAPFYDSSGWLSPSPLEIVAEIEDTDTPVGDAVYKRNMTIEKKYDVKIKMVSKQGMDETDTLIKAVAAGETTYDAVLIFGNNVPRAVTSDLLINVANLPFIDLNNPWWDPAVTAMSVANKQFLMAGDLLILDNEATNAMIFNKKLMTDWGMELPYNMAKQGKWTMDTMNSMIKNVAKDLNGDGKMTAFEDQWGLAVYNDTLHALLVGGGGTLALKDDNDIPYIDLASHRNLAVMDKAMDLMYNPDYVVNCQSAPYSAKRHKSSVSEIYRSGFEEDRMLFVWIRMRVVEQFRGMESEFGILPMPKYDELQENYYSVVNPFATVMLGMPKSADDLNRVSIILEALSAESSHTLQSAYYDVVLQRKYVRDAESSEMLDIIFNSRVYDIGGVYNFGNVFYGMIALSSSYDRNIVSFVDSGSGAMKQAIEQLVKTYQNMD